MTIHEYGHAVLDRGHSGNPDSVMYPSLTDNPAAPDAYWPRFAGGDPVWWSVALRPAGLDCSGHDCRTYWAPAARRRAPGAKASFRR